MRTHEKEYLRPLVSRVDGAVSVLGEYLKGKVATNEFDAPLLTTNSTTVQKDNKPDWAKGFIAQEVKQQTIKVESTNNEKQLLEMTIKIEKLEKKNIYLSEKIDFVKSRIEVTKKHSETQYLLKLDEAEYLDLIQ